MQAFALEAEITVAGNVAERPATAATKKKREKMSRPINNLRDFLVASGGGNEGLVPVGKSLIINELPLPLPLRREDPSPRGSSPHLTATASRSSNDQSNRSGLGPRHGQLYHRPSPRRGIVGRSATVGDYNRAAGPGDRPLVHNSAAAWSGAAELGPRRTIRLANSGGSSSAASAAGGELAR